MNPARIGDDMMNLAGRDAEILKLRREDWSYKKIGQKFHISRERVRQIVSRLEAEEGRNERSKDLRVIIQACNDIEKKWPRDFILDALLLQGRPRWSMQRFMEDRGMTEASLKDLMDFLIADAARLPVNRLEAMPAYGQRDVGAKTYAALVDRFSGLDLGPAFNLEWSTRVRKLIRHLMSVGQYIPSLLWKYPLG